MTPRCLQWSISFQPTDGRYARKEGRPFKRLPLLRPDAHPQGAKGDRVQLPASATRKRRWCSHCLQTDLLDIMEAVVEERLDGQAIQWKKGCAACVVMASGGYPGSYAKGIAIEGLDEGGQVPGATVYHAGTKQENGRFVTAGGRVLGVTAVGDTLDEALERAYRAVEKIHFEGQHYRHDIGRIV